MLNDPTLPPALREKKKERHGCNNSVDSPEEPKPKLHGQLQLRCI
jgi:hypothetical protein